MLNSRERFLKTLKNEEVDRAPVWLMRQAGRYLPEYRAIKQKHSTKVMMQTPELAAEITIQPVTRLGVDAAILYSDILMIPDALGMGLNFVQGEGPQFEFAIDNLENFSKLNEQNVLDRLSYVFEAAKLCVKQLPKEVPLLGFAGAPFTVACYMIAGKSHESFVSAKKLAWENPKLFHQVLDLISRVTIEYLTKQVDAGAIAVQLFDTWAGLLSHEDYVTFAKPYSQRIFTELKKRGISTIHFIKGGNHLLEEMTQMGSSVLGLDWRIDLADLQKKIGDQFVLQGNFDPDILKTNPAVIEQHVKNAVARIPNVKKGVILNLGHGVDQFTPVENVAHFVKVAQSF